MNRDLLRTVILPAVVIMLLGLAGVNHLPVSQDPAPDARESLKEKTMNVHYLEIVTPEVDGTCAALEKMHGVTFGNPVAELGNARTAALREGGRIGVRAPMHDAEKPVVRPYVLVDDVKAAVKQVEAAGAEIALPYMEIPGQGKIAIYFLGGIEHGLWQK